MATISDLIMQSSRPVPSAPNVGSTAVRVADQQARSASTEQKVQQAERNVTEQDVQKAVEQANVEVATSNESISFGYEAKINQLYVTVTDKDTGEVIREIPSREFIEHRIAMREMIGLLLDKEV